MFCIVELPVMFFVFMIFVFEYDLIATKHLLFSSFRRKDISQKISNSSSFGAENVSFNILESDENLRHFTENVFDSIFLK